MRLDTLSALNAERAARRPALIVTDPADGGQRLVRAAEIDAGNGAARAGARTTRVQRDGEGRTAVALLQSC